MKFEIPRVDLEKQKIKKVKQMTLELAENHLEFICIFRAEEPTVDSNGEQNDDSLGYSEYITNLKIFALKQNVAGIERSFRELTNIWCVLIIINGFGSDIKIYYKTEKEADEMYEKLKEWRLIS